VQAICDYAHERISFGYHHARGDRTAFEAPRGAHRRLPGISHHLAVTLCRCMNIPARYCTGYLGDIGVPLDPAPMDFSAWFEVYLDGRAGSPLTPVTTTRGSAALVDGARPRCRRCRHPQPALASFSW